MLFIILTIIRLLKRFLEQNTAGYTALEAMNNAGLVKAVSSVDSDMLKSVINVLEPFQTATTVMSSDSLCTISLILPLQHSLNTKCADAMQEDLDSRYKQPKELLMLQESSCLDPQFKAVADLPKDEVDSLY